MNKITPHLWFDMEAQAAAKLYTSLFDNSSITQSVTLHNTPSGDAGIVTIVLAGQTFMLLNGGPLFKFNPSISFVVSCNTKADVDKLWEKLSAGGSALMELGSYPFSEHYGWLQDKFGLSWQLMFVGGQAAKQKITPSLMYVGAQYGKAEEAINLYVSTFPNSGIEHVMRRGPGQEPDREGTVQHAAFTLAGQDFAAMESAHDHRFSFNEAISFVVHCDDQAEIDYYWERLSADPSAEQCGWLKDKFTVSWQVVPAVMDKMMADKDEARLARVTEAFLKMKKFDIAKLEKAYEGK